MDSAPPITIVAGGTATYTRSRSDLIKGGLAPAVFAQAIIYISKEPAIPETAMSSTLDWLQRLGDKQKPRWEDAKRALGILRGIGQEVIRAFDPNGAADLTITGILNRVADLAAAELFRDDEASLVAYVGVGDYSRFSKRCIEIFSNVCRVAPKLDESYPTNKPSSEQRQTLTAIVISPAESFHAPGKPSTRALRALRRSGTAARTANRRKTAFGNEVFDLEKLYRAAEKESEE